MRPEKGALRCDGDIVPDQKSGTGFFNLMQMQPDRKPRDSLIFELVVATQRDFPKSVVHNGLKDLNQSRPLTALF
jgi:hypothetical protein